VQRGARGPATVSYDFYPYLYGFGGSIYKDQVAGDYSVTLNNEAGLAALQYYLMLAKEAGHPQTASLDQAEVIQNMATGKAAHIMAVISAWSQVDDPDKSAVVDKVEFAPTPHAPGFSTGSGLGHWLGGIAKNIPDDRKRGALEFLRWFQTRDAQLANAKFGGIPINAASYRDPISQERKFRWMKPLADSLQHAVSVYQFPESSEVIAILELGLNQAVARNVEAPAALNDMADKIHGVMTKYGYRTAKLPPLR
jgi:multiple sugar transport system substrate-binding protein